MGGWSQLGLKAKLRALEAGAAVVSGEAKATLGKEVRLVKAQLDQVPPPKESLTSRTT